MRHSHLGVQPRRAPAASPSALRRAGAGLVEYVLLIALVAVGLVAILIQFRNQPGRIFNESSNSVGSAGISSYGSSGAGGNGNGNGNGNAGGNGNGNAGGNGNGNAGGNGNGNGR